MKEQICLQVSNLYIAQVKRKCGILERVNYNLPKSEDSRQPIVCRRKRKLMRERDSNKGIGLIESVRQGLGKPKFIYVRNFVSGSEEKEKD